jgi:hypothetical protein
MVIPPKKLKPRSCHAGPIAAETFTKGERGFSKPPNVSLEYFEMDRSTVLEQLQNLRRTIDEGAKEMEMVAAERVFDKSLSRLLEGRARSLHRTAKDLNSLLRSVARAHIPRSG